MAGQGRKTFSDGEVLSAADVNGYLMDQSVMRFADSTARTAATGTPTEGMVTYLDDVNQIEVYDGTAWVDQQAPILSEGTAGQYLQSNGTAGSQWVTLEIAENIITTQGDLIVGASDNTPERLGIGAADTVLTSDGTAISWAAGGGGGGGFNTLTEITATNSSFTVPSASSNIFKFTVVGAGGGGFENGVGAGTSGGNSILVADGVTTTANGGPGGNANFRSTRSGNNKMGVENGGGVNQAGGNARPGASGGGGGLEIVYHDLDGISTIDVTVGAGGSGFDGGGFDGVILMEFTA